MKKINILLSGLLFFTISQMNAQFTFDEYNTLDIVAEVPQGTAAQITAQQSLKLYHPADLKNYPTLIWFQTGHSPQIPEAFQNYKMAVVAPPINQELAVNEQMDQAALAVAWVMNSIDNYGGDARKIFVGGHAQGGDIATMLGMDAKWLGKYNQSPTQLMGLVPFSGQAKQSSLVNPTAHASKDVPPLLMVVGDRNMDAPGQYDKVVSLWTKLKSVGHTYVQYMEIKGQDQSGMLAAGYQHAIRFMHAVQRKRDRGVKE